MILLLLVVAIGALLLPLSAALVLGTLLVTAIANYALALSPLVESGGAEIHLQDFVLLLLAIRIGVVAVTRRMRIYVHPLFIALALYLVTLLAATLLAALREPSVFQPEIVAWLRLTAQISPIVLFPFAVRNMSELRIGMRCVEFCGYAIAASVLLAEILGRAGLRSELVPADGFIRRFGPVGDQVAWVLPFFLCLHVIRRQIAPSVFFLVAILLTGGRSALVAMVGALAIIAWNAANSKRLNLRTTAAAACMIALAAFLFVCDVGGVRTRFSGPYLRNGLEQRLAADEIGIQLFLQHPIAGVGFTGYRFAATDQGDSLRMELSPNFLAATGNPYVQVLDDGGLLALAAVAFLMWRLLAFFRAQIRHDISEISTLASASFIYLLAMLLGNQTAPWLLPGSLITYVVFLPCGLLIAAERVASEIETPLVLGFKAMAPSHAVVAR